MTMANVCHTYSECCKCNSFYLLEENTDTSCCLHNGVSTSNVLIIMLYYYHAILLSCYIIIMLYYYLSMQKVSELIIDYTRWLTTADAADADAAVCEYIGYCLYTACNCLILHAASK